MHDLFPDQLKRLPNNHPIWTAKFTLDPVKDKLELWGVEMGCRTVVVYSPKDLSCAWESNDHDGRAQKAFQLGANIIAYATGLELPQDRGTRIEIIKDDPNEKKLPRGALKVAQLRYGRSDGDWKPAPRAMRNLLFELRDLGLKVDLRADPIDVPDANLKDFKFLYLHGRNAFSFKEHLKHLQFNLKHGGLLFADACCGSKPFDKSFRELVVELFGQELKPIPPDDELFSKELNGVKITEVRCRREGPDGKPETELRTVAPALEGVKVNGRWAVIYSKYDIGCALEKSQSTNCLGHDHASAVLLGKAVVLYALKR